MREKDSRAGAGKHGRPFVRREIERDRRQSGAEAERRTGDDGRLPPVRKLERDDIPRTRPKTCETNGERVSEIDQVPGAQLDGLVDEDDVRGPFEATAIEAFGKPLSSGFDIDGACSAAFVPQQFSLWFLMVPMVDVGSSSGMLVAAHAPRTQPSAAAAW
jgi:hypothetical protein